MRRREVLWGLGGAGVLGVASCQTSAKTPPVEANDAGIEAAFFYAFPLYEMARTAENRAALPGLNKLGHRAQLADHTARQITAPNNDTVYSSSQLELSNAPVEVVAPTDRQRYFNIAFMDAFTDNFAGIGTRPTKGQGGRFWIAGPTWSGTAPAGVTVIRSSTNDVWMLARVVVEGPDDIAAAKALQQQIVLKPTTDCAGAAFRREMHACGRRRQLPGGGERGAGALPGRTWTYSAGRKFRQGGNRVRRGDAGPAGEVERLSAHGHRKAEGEIPVSRPRREWLGLPGERRW
ncbi:MAG: DUF1254 domain-containing protein [Hyphomonadaceae bacterium]|nr:DUF1254 domain-containing protein [Hyphomonadaceae bacterium]